MQQRDIAVSKQREDQVRAHIAAVNAGDVDAIVATFSPNARQRFGNRPWMHGRAEIEEGFVAFTSIINSMRNEITGIWESAGTVIVRLDVRCERLDGSVIEVPSVCIFTDGPDGLIESFQLWSDWSPLFPTVSSGLGRG